MDEWRVRKWGAVDLVPARFACRGGCVVTEKRAVEDAMMGKKAWNPGAVFLGSDTTWEQCLSGWECCDGEEGSRGLDGQFERAVALFLSKLVMFGGAARC
eukprot:FR738451.1.p1 GENE.FR738451.1~~FR738451.1.p1  ORF type:complete len:100 (+),score=9.09 FR738451.1:257-556(+)